MKEDVLVTNPKCKHRNTMESYLSYHNPKGKYWNWVVKLSMN